MTVRHWFDTREGKLVVGQAAYEQVVEQSLPGDVLPLVDILTRIGPEIDITYFEKPATPPSYTREQALEHGKWVLSILAQAEKPTQLKNYHFDRLSRLGLGMGIQSVRRQLGEKIWQISEALGAEKGYAPFGSFDGWEEFEFIENAQQLAQSLRHRGNPKPTKSDYAEWARRGNGPSPAIIEAKTGFSIRELNELIGFFNSREKDPEKLLDWGVKTMLANNNTLPTKYVIEILSRRKRGPGNTLIRSHFGSLGNFQVQLTKRHKLHVDNSQPVRDEWKLAKHVELLTAHFDERAPQNTQTKLALAARFEVARQLLIGLRNSELAQIAYETNAINFINRLTSENYHLDAKQIKSLAWQLGYYELIWPTPNSSVSYLRVTDKQLAREKARFAASQRAARAKQAS